MSQYTISSAGKDSIGGYVGFLSLGNAAWQEANTAILVPFRVLATIRVQSLFVYNGSNTGNNIDIGIYDKTGRRLLSLGSTARSGVSVLQIFPISSYILVSETYYMAINLDGTTGSLTAYSGNVEFQRSTGIVQVNAAFPLPATVKFAQNARSLIPVFGLSGESMT